MKKNTDGNNQETNITIGDISNTNKNFTVQDLQRKGYFLLPLPARQKYPPPANWIHQTVFYDIPANGNVAISTRGELGILISNDEASTQWATERFGTPNVRSKRGAHWYFKNSKNLPNESNKQTTVGVFEFHTTNKYALIPPSIHPSGAAYEWARKLPPASELLEAPDFKDLFHPGGTHHQELLHLSASLAGKGKTIPEIFQALKDRVNTFPDPEGHPEKEISEMTQSAFAKFHDDSRGNSGRGAAMTTADEAGNNAPDGGLNPDSWFIDTQKGPKFVPHRCAVDIRKVHPEIITEYVPGQGVPSKFTGMYWIRNGEGILRTELEEQRILSPGQIRTAIESLCNMTRIIDPRKIGLSLDAIMPLPPHTIPIESGLMNLQTKELKPHSTDYFYTEYIPRRYIPGAIPNAFNRLLGAIFKDDPKAELKKTQIFEIIAWTLMKDYNIQGAVILYGQGGEGKSLIHAVFEKLLIHTSSVTLEELETDKYKRPMLYGSWANIVSETSINIIGSSWFKRVTDGTQITVEEKNAHPFKMVSHAKLIIDTNELPNMEKELRAFYRRVIAVIDFTTMLETIMSPTEIGDVSRALADPGELDAIFSYVVDNYYGPLVHRMKFTGHLDIRQAEQVWVERSDPAAAYIRLKDAADQIITDVEGARAMLMEAGADERRLQRCVTRDPNGTEDYLTTIKQDVIAEAVKWAKEKGFPVKNVHAGTLGKALSACGYPNLTANKKIGKSSPVKAWRDVLIMVGSGFEVENQNDQLPEKVGSEISPDDMGSGSPSKHEVAGSGFYIPADFLIKNPNIEKYRDTATVAHVKVGSPATHPDFSLRSSEKKQVVGDLKKTVTEPLPQNEKTQPDPVNSDAQNENNRNRMDRTTSHIQKKELGLAISLDDGNIIRDQLIALGYQLDPSLCGESMDRKHYKLGIRNLTDPEKREQFLSTMSSSNFTQVNRGEFGILFFTRPLKEVPQ